MKLLFNFLKYLRDYIQILSKKEFDIIFFSEGKDHLVFLEPILKYLDQNFKFSILYITLDPKDVTLRKEPNIDYYYFPSISYAYSLLGNIKSKFLITTINDIGNAGYLKKTENIKYYIYTYHSLISTLSGYSYNSLKNFDIIFCAAKYQVTEIRFLEKKYSQNRKKLFPLGYSKINNLRKYENQSDNNMILLAFTWGSNSFFSNHKLDKLIEILLNDGYQVCIRPHPETFKQDSKRIRNLMSLFKHDKLILDNQGDDYYLRKAKILITDWSGIFFDFYFGLGKKTIFIKSNRKNNNLEFESYNIKTHEELIRNKISDEVQVEDVLKALNKDLKYIDDDFLYKNFERNLYKFFSKI